MSLRIPLKISKQHVLPSCVFLYLHRLILLCISDAQTGRREIYCLLVRSWFRSRTFVAIPRGLHADCGTDITAKHHGVLLRNHLLGDLARYEASISYDVATRVSSEKIQFFTFLSSVVVWKKKNSTFLNNSRVLATVYLLEKYN